MMLDSDGTADFDAITAVNLLGEAAHLVLPGSHAHVLVVLGIGYGSAILAIAVGYAALATTVTLRVAAEHLPFSLTWWSFTFPVGTWVTGEGATFFKGNQYNFTDPAVIRAVDKFRAAVKNAPKGVTSEQARNTGFEPFRAGAVALFVALLTAWAMVAARTARGAAHGSLLLNPRPGL